MIKLYNTLTRKKETFKPENDVVKMYTCGPTVYSYAHIGNLRAYIFMDMLRRTIKANGYKIDGVINLTDVGHLTSDEDEGEDKLILAGKRENKSPWEISEFYTKYFLEKVSDLHIDMPEHIVKATDVIDQMISFVQVLVEKGYAYETQKGIYFDVQKFKEYGQLSGISIEQRKAGARIEVDESKHHPADFALWIKAPKEHIMQWKSPWGMGYPGWHIECSAIGQKYLGDKIDIHTGGIDHITVHHENEIAQNNCYYGRPVVKFWVHLEFLQVDGGKMGKSLGNMYTMEDLAKRGFRPLDFKFFVMGAHYRKAQNFTFEALKASQTTLNKIYQNVIKHRNGDATFDIQKLEEYQKRIMIAINDNINYTNAITVLFEMLKDNAPSKDIYKKVIELDQIFGLDLANADKYIIVDNDIPDDIKALAEERWQAKCIRDWAKADDIRNKLSSMGYETKDSKDSYEIVRLN